MTFAQSPYPDVVNKGLRIDEIRDELNAAGWDTSSLDAALKALTDDNGTVVLPNGVTELNAAMRAVFERLPQVMQQAHSLYEVEFKKLAPTEPAAPPQTVTIDFNLAASVQPGDFANTPVLNVDIVTSDGLPTENPIDLSISRAGTAIEGNDYDWNGPTQIPAATNDGTSFNIAAVDILGANNGGPPVLNMTIDADPAYIVGAQNTHAMTIQDAGA